ncbi:hypothetical protein ACS0TY_001325 [Phlomoides rotata]
MQGGRNPFFGFSDPFGSFGGFGGDQSGLISNFFGGRDPFDDPFFTQPFGSMFQSSFFGSNRGPFMNPHAPGLIEHQPHQPNLLRGPVIEELNSDDEKEEKEKKENPRKHGRSSKEPVVEDPDDEVTEKKIKHMTHRNDMNHVQHIRSQPQMHSFSFQSSSVSYGGTNGTHYTSSATRRAGSDGLAFEEFKEADSSTRQATHRVSRGIHDKGHSLTRKLKSDGHVDTMQTLHNLNEGDLVGFEEAWAGNARKHLPGLNEQFSSRDVLGSRSVGNRGSLALPSTVRPNNLGRSNTNVGGMAGAPQHSGTGTRGRSYRSGPSQQGSRRY